LAKLTTTFIRRAKPKKAEDGASLSADASTTESEEKSAEKSTKAASERPEANVEGTEGVASAVKDYGTYNLSSKY